MGQAGSARGTVLGADLEEGGLREILVVMEELGRAACPAPMWSAVLANLVLSGASSGPVAELRQALHAGTARVAFSFGAFDPDPSVGSIKLHGEQATGSLRFVEAAGSATHLLVAVDAMQLALVDLGAPGVNRVPTRAMGAWGNWELTLDAAPARRSPAGNISLERSAIDCDAWRCWRAPMARRGARSSWRSTTPRSAASSASRSAASRRSSTSSPTA